MKSPVEHDAAEKGAQRKGNNVLSTAATVRVVSASRWYGEVMGCNDASFELTPGITGLLGPNGAGKSTIIKLLAGQLAPSRGEVTVLGARVSEDRAVLRRIGWCPEHEGVCEELTGAQFVAAMTELHGFSIDEARERADKAIANVGLDEAKGRRLGTYSKGMRQRIKIAQAIAHDPDVVLLDEPLTGCDPVARARVLEVIRGLGERGRTVLLSSHVLHEIEAVTRRILVVHRGVIVAQGDVHAIRDLIDRHPHRIRIVCDKPRVLARALVVGDEITAIELPSDDPRVLIVDTRSPDACYPRIPEVARAEGVRIDALTSPDDNLAAVFRYLTEAAGPPRNAATGGRS